MNQIHSLQLQLSEQQRSADASSQLVSKFELQLKEKDEQIKSAELAKQAVERENQKWKAIVDDMVRKEEERIQEIGELKK